MAGILRGRAWYDPLPTNSPVNQCKQRERQLNWRDADVIIVDADIAAGVAVIAVAAVVIIWYDSADQLFTLKSTPLFFEFDKVCQ